MSHKETKAKIKEIEMGLAEARKCSFDSSRIASLPPRERETAKADARMHLEEARRVLDNLIKNF